MRIDFHGHIGDEYDAYAAMCRRILRWGDDNLDAHVNVYQRDREGALEWHADLRDPEGKQIIFLAMLQREPGAAFSFHS
jgi:hypothetical protein